MEEPARTHLWTRTALAAALAVLIAIAAVFLITRQHREQPAPTVVTMSTSPAASPSDWSPSPQRLPDDVTTSWAYLDSIDGGLRQVGDQNQHPLDYLIVPGAAQDYMDTLTSRDQSMTPYGTAAVFAALAQNTSAGDNLIRLAGGPDTVTADIIEACALTGMTADPPAATATAVAQYAACLREGALADPETAGWVLDQMRNNAGGIGDERGNDGSQRLAQFNSVTKAGDRYRTWCLGVGAYWSAGVWVDAPAERGELFGVAACALVARSEFPPDTQPAPGSELPTPAGTATCPYDTCRGTD